VTTSDAELARTVRMLSDHGRPPEPGRRGEHLRPGVNSRLDALQAAALRVKLAHLPAWRVRREEIASRYVEALEGRDDVRLSSAAGCEPAWHVFALRHARRDALVSELAREGVQARVVYPRPLHALPALESLGNAPGDFPEAEAWSREVLALPMFPELTDEEVDRVVVALGRSLDAVRRAGAA